MSKADKERQARRQRMLARERGHTSTYGRRHGTGKHKDGRCNAQDQHRQNGIVAALTLLAAILIPVLVRQMTPQPVSGFERTYWDYQALYHFDDTDIDQLVAQYQLNGEPLNVFASYLVRWGEDGKILSVNLIRCEVPEKSPWDNRFYADPFILSVGEDSFQVVLQISAKEADKERSTDQNECYTIHYDNGLATAEFDGYPF